jgi:ABC-type bacteriocin/lantibiotic exporter with double-glycine peptidase domain
VIRRYGPLKARVSVPGHGDEARTISRRELAERLGASSLDQEVEFGIVHPERPAEPLRGGRPDQVGDASGGEDGHSHGHGHGHDEVHPARRFLELLRPEAGEIWTILVFSVITGFLYLALPLAVNALVSNLAFGSQSGPYQQALFILGIVLLVALSLGGALRGLQHYVIEVVQRRLFVRLTADLSHRLPRVDARSLEGVHPPELVNRFLDVVTMQKSTALILLTGVNLVLSTLIGMTVLAFYHPFLLAFSAVLVGALAFIVWGLGRGAVSTSVAESHCKYHVVGWLEELARCPRLFKGPGGYELAAGRADDLARHYLDARRKHFRVLMRQIVGLLALEVVASAALLMVGGFLVISQQLTLGQLVASEIIVTAIVASIAKLGKQFEAWYDALASVNKLGHLVDLDIERETGETPPPREGGMSVAMEDAVFAYGEKFPVFSGVSVSLEPGERVALFGSQGSGASTMLDLLHGMRVPTGGFLLLDGLDVRSWNLEALRRNVALLRAGDIVDGTIAENLRLGRVEISTPEIKDALARAGLLRDVLALPGGVNTPLLAGGLPLSSRQRVRLLVARALLMKPRLLLLDEILDGLDRDTLAELTSVLLEPAHSWTVVASTRDESVRARFARVVNLDDLECHRKDA